MNCCAAAVDAAARMSGPSPDEIRLSAKDLGQGLRQTDLSVPAAHCAACIAAVEGALKTVEGVEAARLNLTTRRLTVKWRGEQPPPLVETLARAGYEATLFESDGAARDPELTRLIRAMAFAGFGAMNIMLMSVSVWSGADADTRQAFHWISAALALPVLLYSGRIFYQSAWGALRHGRTNMDVPISIGVTLAFGLSLYDTVHHGRHAYFDASTSLLFFLLIGRTFDHMMRTRARTAILGLGRMMPRGATVLREDGARDYLPAEEIRPGMRLAVAVGDRLAVDATVEEGASEVDCSVATGESAPQAVGAGAALRAGSLNLSGPLTVVATSDSRHSFLAEMMEMMQAAEGGRARYRRIADRASRLYSPVVHLTALLTLIGWVVATGDWHNAVSIAIAVLIITCPCALGLAVPMVQVMAARRLFEAGIMVKDGSGMERLTEIDSVAFDKTGTLTLGQPRLVEAAETAPGALAIAAALARHSRHPAAVAIQSAAPARAVAFEELRETPGLGLEGRALGSLWRLGRPEWACGEAGDGTVLSRDGARVAAFGLADALRPGARAAVDEIKAMGLPVVLLSGDNEAAVARVAAQLGVEDAYAGLLPQDKIARLAALAREGRKTLMVGDGLNDAPALTAAHVSMAPASAADIGRNAADFVFLRNSLAAAPQAIKLCRAADRLVKQNFALAVAYNAIALPVAIAGHVTPLIAALAMSLSSILVVANALRLKAIEPPPARGAPAPTLVSTPRPVFET